MQVISKQSLLFKAEGKEDFVLSNSAVRIFAPDWIKDTPLYKLAEADGTIEEVEVKSPAPTFKKQDSGVTDTGLQGGFASKPLTDSVTGQPLVDPKKQYPDLDKK